MALRPFNIRENNLLGNENALSEQYYEFVKKGSVNVNTLELLRI